jgi:DNA-binding MarR family transcriptional regulator
MITRDADLTRMLDRLESRGLLTRQRQRDDRRVVHILITPPGSKLLAELDPVVAEMNRKIFANLQPQRLTELVELLEHVCDQVEQPKDP